MTADIEPDLADRLGHELRTPLTVIRGYAEVLCEEAGAGLPAGQRACLQAILRGAARLEDAVVRLEAELRARGPVG